MALTLDGTNGIVSSGSITTQSSSGVIFSDSSALTAASSPYALKNRIINGDMRIDQRNAGSSVTPTAATAVYTVDRWFAYQEQASKFSVQQVSANANTSQGFDQSLRVTSLSAYTVGSAEVFQIQQRIEGYNVADLAWGTASAKTVTLSFWVYSSLTGTFGGSIRNASADRSYPFSYTISSANTWTKATVTVSGDTTGTWLTTNGVGIIISFGLGIGSTLSNTAGSWYAGNYVSATGATSVVGTNGATFYITGVQLEVGSTATPFERRMYGTELALCQRYYYCIGGAFNGNPNSQNYGIGAVYDSTYCDIVVPFPVTMRGNPTYTLVNPSNLQVFQGTSSRAVSSSALDATSPTCVPIYFAASTLTGGYAVRLNQNGTNQTQMQFSAEL